MALVAWKLKIPTQEAELKESQFSKIMRIDFLGAFLLSTSIVWGLLVLDLVAQQISWLDLRILALFGASLVTGICFLLIEAFWATEPIFPLRLLLNRDVVTSYINLGFQSAAQMAVGVLRPRTICLITSSTDDGVRSAVFSGLCSRICYHCRRTSYAVRYWQCCRRSHYWPSHKTVDLSVLPNGSFKEVTDMNHRTGRYKLISAIGALSSSTAYLLMMLRWHGHTSFLESLYVAPGGFGNGVALSASFISLTAGVEPCQLAIASSGLYLSSNIGMVGGLSITTAIMQSTLTKQLRISLKGIDDRERASFAARPHS
jgi:hypothetical protein